MSEAQPFNLQQILDNEWLMAYFQPIVSVRKKTIVGYEGLTRGIHPFDRRLIPPKALFHQAGSLGAVLELDRLCRKTVLENFREIQKKEPEAILSLNFEASVIDQGVVGSGSLIQQVKALGINPQSVAIEIIESHVDDVVSLQKFIHTYRDYGFLIALDDVGAGHSNLNRIPLLKPDILKIDQFLVQNINKDFYKQEVFKSLVNLAHKIGALIVSEGIETEAEALFVTEQGVDMMQGYYFYKPQPKEDIKNHVVELQVRDFQDQLKNALFEKLRLKNDSLHKYEGMTRKIQAELVKSASWNFDQKLLELIHHYPSVECMYILDENGIQVSDTVFADAGIRTKNRLIFRPAVKQTDHSMKDYYYMLFNAGHRRTTYVTEPYISLATGNSCVTFCRVFRDVEDKERVLCVDINNDYLKIFA